MKTNSRHNALRHVFFAIFATLVVTILPARAIEETVYWDGTSTTGDADGGDGTWNNSNTNWDDAATGGADIAWDVNTSGDDTAVLGGASGTVTLGEDISLKNLTMSGTSANYWTIQGNTLNFASGGAIANTNGVGGNWVTTSSITSGISGAPSVTLNTGGNAETIFAPTTGTMTLGGVSGGGLFAAGGTTTGNTVASVSGKLRKEGTGTWTLTGLASGYEHFIDGGDLIVSTGTLRSNNRAIKLYGGTLHYNNPGAVYDTGNTTTTSSDSSHAIAFRGGNLDNTNGAAITTSTYNPDTWWVSDWTFIGSNGANSDLNLGTGNAIMFNDSRQVTVQHADTTLTIGGVVSDNANNYSFTKAGAGTLVFGGSNTYTGDTIVSDGTLSLNQTYLSDIAGVSIASGATLNLNYSGIDEIFSLNLGGSAQPAGQTYGAIGSGAVVETAFITGNGWLEVYLAEPVVGTRWWDGGTTNIGTNGDQVSDGGDGTWNSTTVNWDAGVGVSHQAWNNAADDVAIFDGTAGTVTLAEDVNLGGMTFEATTTGDYTITGQTLNFAADSVITTNIAGVTIESAVTGSPAVAADQGTNQPLTFAPIAGVVTLGAVIGSGSILEFAGDTTGNSVASLGNVKGNWNGTGEWTLTGLASAYEHWIQSGDMIVGPSGEIRSNNRALKLQGGTLHYNNPGAVWDGSSGNPSANGGWTLAISTGAAIDNTSGTAITTSTYNPDMAWLGDWTFIGSNGAASDLDLGSGGVLLANADRQVTVQHADTTLTVGGVIQDGGNGFGLTKAGPGTLKLTGASTYTGDTTVDGGVLHVGPDGEIASTNVYINNGAHFLYDNGTTPLSALVAISEGTIGGSGEINTPVTVGNNAVVSPGNSPGTQTYSAGLTLTGNNDPGIAGTYLWEMADITGGAGTGWDLINVTGGDFDISALSDTNKFNIDITGWLGGGTAPALEVLTTFDIIDYDTIAEPVGGFSADLFNLTVSSFNASWSKVQWTLVQDTQNGILQLQAFNIPEPSTAILAGLGVAGLVLRRRRRNTK